MKTYTQLRKVSNTGAEKMDCSVIAVAAAAGVSYGKAHAMLRREGREDRRRTPPAFTVKAMDKLGFDLHAGDLEGKTVKTFARNNPEGVFMVSTRGHIATVYNGKVFDDDRSLGKRVKAVFIVTKKEEVS